MRMRRIFHSCVKANQHADETLLRVGREQFARDARRNLLPVGFHELRRRRQRRLPTWLGCDTTSESLPQGLRRAQDLLRPKRECIDHWTKRREPSTAFTARCEM